MNAFARARPVTASGAIIEVMAGHLTPSVAVRLRVDTRSASITSNIEGYSESGRCARTTMTDQLTLVENT
jgi:hypothetical protein